MSDQFIGEIRMFAGDYAPQGWLFCHGQALPINSNQALYALIGTTYGGDGYTTFKLPDLRGRAPIHYSSSYPLGQMGGSEQVTLSLPQLPSHTHVPHAKSVQSETTSHTPAGQVWGFSDLTNYQTGSPNASMSSVAIASNGSNFPHNNMMPSLVVHFIIATDGIFPSEG